VVYRDPLTSNARLTVGTYATSRVPAGAVGVAATTQMAYRFGLRPGTRLTLDTSTGTVRLYVTGIVAERAPASTFWTQDATVGTPSLSSPAHPYWVIGVIADPDQLVAMEYALSGPGLRPPRGRPLRLSANSHRPEPSLPLVLHALTRCARANLRLSLGMSTGRPFCCVVEMCTCPRIIGTSRAGTCRIVQMARLWSVRRLRHGCRSRPGNYVAAQDASSG
jgi:hypothetical protein